MALHVITEIGVPGRIERERRHFAEQRGYDKATVRGRHFIPHGEGSQPTWNPHPHCLQVKYSDKGLDWSSRLRYIPAPTDPEPREDFKLPSLRCYPGGLFRNPTEWSFYPEGYHIGKLCQFPPNALPKDKNHLASMTSSKEITHSMMLGKNKKLPSTYERRGYIPAAASGDKSYQAVEYSPQFHTFGSTRPIVNFGGDIRKKHDTFVPLQDLPSYPSERYSTKERRRKYRQELESVQQLDVWEPAIPLGAPFGSEESRKYITV